MKYRTGLVNLCRLVKVSQHAFYSESAWYKHESPQTEGGISQNVCDTRPDPKTKDSLKIFCLNKTANWAVCTNRTFPLLTLTPSGYITVQVRCVCVWNMGMMQQLYVLSWRHDTSQYIAFRFNVLTTFCQDNSSSVSAHTWMGGEHRHYIIWSGRRQTRDVSPPWDRERRGRGGVRRWVRSFLNSYAVPAHARRVVITHRDDLKDGDRRRKGKREKGGEVFRLINVSGPEIYSRTVNSTSTRGTRSGSGSVVLLITPVDVIMCDIVWESIWWITFKVTFVREKRYKNKEEKKTTCNV